MNAAFYSGESSPTATAEATTTAAPATEETATPYVAASPTGLDPETRPAEALPAVADVAAAEPVSALPSPATFGGSSDAAESVSEPGGDTAAGVRPEEEEGGDSLDPGELTEEEQKEVTELRERDREVRAHEQSHLAAAGPYAQGGAQYDYQRGPDGRRYAVGGEVHIDTSEAKEPEETIRKAQVIRRAAMAPAEPSPQDRRVATEASRMESEARQELSQKRREEATGSGDEGGGSDSVGDSGQAAASGETVEVTPGQGTGNDADVSAVAVPELGADESKPDPGVSTASTIGTFDGDGGAGQILDLIA